jgi:hypothetical protein
LIVIAKKSLFAVAIPITRHPSRWNAALAEHPCGVVPAPVSAIPKACVLKVAQSRRLTFMVATPPSGGLDFAVQEAADEFRNAQPLAARFLGQPFLGLTREAERHRDTALGQFRSGHADICMILSYTLSRLKILADLYCL